MINKISGYRRSEMSWKMLREELVRFSFERHACWNNMRYDVTEVSDRASDTLVEQNFPNTLHYTVNQIKNCQSNCDFLGFLHRNAKKLLNFMLRLHFI